MVGARIVEDIIEDDVLQHLQNELAIAKALEMEYARSSATAITEVTDVTEFTTRMQDRICKPPGLQTLHIWKNCQSTSRHCIKTMMM